MKYTEYLQIDVVEESLKNIYLFKQNIANLKHGQKKIQKAFKQSIQSFIIMSSYHIWDKPPQTNKYVSKTLKYITNLLENFVLHICYNFKYGNKFLQKQRHYCSKDLITVIKHIFSRPTKKHNFYLGGDGRRGKSTPSVQKQLLSLVIQQIHLYFLILTYLVGLS